MTRLYQWLLLGELDQDILFEVVQVQCLYVFLVDANDNISVDGNEALFAAKLSEQREAFHHVVGIHFSLGKKQEPIVDEKRLFDFEEMAQLNLQHVLNFSIKVNEEQISLREDQELLGVHQVAVLLDVLGDHGGNFVESPLDFLSGKSDFGTGGGHERAKNLQLFVVFLKVSFVVSSVLVGLDLLLVDQF